MPLSGVIVIADLAQIPRQHLKDEYARDRMERSVIVYDVLGKNDVTRRYLNWPQNKFLRQGYNEEEKVLGVI